MATGFPFTPLTPPSSADSTPLLTPPTPVWDAYATLQVTGRHSMGMSCIGHKGGYNSGGARCKWDIPQNKYERLRGLLDYVELQPPRDARPYLRDVASLSLCQDFHQNQAYSFERHWQDLIQNARTLSPQEISRIMRERNMLGPHFGRGSNMSDPFTDNRDTRLAEASKEIDELKRKLRASEERAQISQEYLAQVENLKANMTQHFEIEKAEALKNTEQIQNLLGLNLDLKDKVQDLNDRLQDEAKRMKVLEENLQQAKLDGQAHFAEAAKLRSQLEEERAVSRNLRVELENADGRTTMLSVENNDLHEKINDLEYEKSKLDEGNKSLKTALALKTEELEQMRGDLRAASTATQNLSTLQQQLRQSQLERENARRALEEAETARLRMQEDFQRAQLQLSSAHMEYHQERTSATQMQEEQSVVKQKYEDAAHRPVRFLLRTWTGRVRSIGKRRGMEYDDQSDLN